MHASTTATREDAISRASRVVFPHRQTVRDALTEFLDTTVANASFVEDPDANTLYVALTVVFWARGVRMKLEVHRNHFTRDYVRGEQRVAYYTPAEPYYDKYFDKHEHLPPMDQTPHWRESIAQMAERDTEDIEELEYMQWSRRCVRNSMPDMVVTSHRDVHGAVDRFMTARFDGAVTGLTFEVCFIVRGVVKDFTITRDAHVTTYQGDTIQDIDALTQRVEQDIAGFEVGLGAFMSRCITGVWNSNSRLIAAKTAGFWHDCMEEFIATTWAPGRFVDWCLPHDERREFVDL